MPSIPLYTSTEHGVSGTGASAAAAAAAATAKPNATGTGETIQNPLPPLLHTPSGLAIIEMQGTINMPHAQGGSHESDEDVDMDSDDEDNKNINHGNDRQNSIDTNGNNIGTEGHTLDVEKHHGLEPKSKQTSYASETPVGRIVFPYYSPSETSADDTKWMKRVHLYVGKHQRLTGEVKKLVNPMAVIRRRQRPESEDVDMDSGTNGTPQVDVKQKGEELEIVEIVRYKILFSQRPEPVSG